MPEPVFLYCACNLNEIPSVVKGGLLLGDLIEAQRLVSEAVLVIDRSALRHLKRIGSAYDSGLIPQDAILNVNPYAPPRAVTAAGGLIRHRVTGELLCIRRHGVLDLPKGKLDPNESIAACAARELQEETGADDLVQGQLLGTTVHGYRRSGFFEVKTTYWYAFTSKLMQFTPALEEGIDAVYWVPYAQAVRELGYPVLRDLLTDLGPLMWNENEL
ncbi:MAG: NUDIX domain-containing protein [Rhodothermaceae bacterium]|nr:NUDIX domain-containing protein [Rhodothermaceae bacterium]MXZ57760.1 NUDIX domain-containing protein [Rhodothermaceae bacterium]MYB91728.1 NUDIX domain-containing protein [Rhodothermaceae bacterium]MYD67558.1 NUDIX domain-containing protein [Rhodothermaceae bacterium]MYG45535.1 NUDIX domain-containing protein [Rhodothermaceae bacterium]